jgi:hypothetical protein
MFSLDVNLYEGLPEDLTLPKLHAYLDMDYNDYSDGRHALAVEAFAALFGCKYQMAQAISDVIEARRDKAGLPRMVPSGPRSNTNAALQIAHERVDAARVHHGVLEFQSVEIIPEGKDS